LGVLAQLTKRKADKLNFVEIRPKSRRDFPEALTAAFLLKFDRNRPRDFAKAH
jgi:hypothetical protein